MNLHKIKFYQLVLLGLGLCFSLVNLIIYTQFRVELFPKEIEQTLLELPPVPLKSQQAQVLGLVSNNNAASVSAAKSSSPTASISAKSYLVTDLNSGSWLTSKEPNRVMAPASTVKLMTALVALETFHPQQVITVPQLEVDGHVIGLRTGEKLLLVDLIKAMLINSANDAAQVLAVSHPGGGEAFIQAMNQKAQELGLSQTKFMNATGLDDPQQYTTAFDLTVLTREVLKNEFLRQVVSVPEDKIADIGLGGEHTLYTTNYFLLSRSDVLGVKTGTTEAAGQVLITLVQLKEPVLIVLLNSQQRYLDTAAIIDQIQTEYDWYEFDLERLIGDKN